MDKKIKNNKDIPKSYKTDVSMLPVFDQRKIPACAAHATVTIMQMAWYKETGKIINFSPRFLDIVSWTDNLSINDGRDGELVMNLAAEIGCCTEDLLPNDTTLPVEQYRDRKIITKEMYIEAAKYKLSNLGLIPVSVGNQDINKNCYLNNNMSKKTIRIRTLSLISSSLGIICGLISTYFFKNLWVNLVFLILIGIIIKSFSNRKLALFFSEFFFLIFLTITFNIFNFNSSLNKIFISLTILLFLCFMVTIGLFFKESLSSIWYLIGEKVKSLKEKRIEKISKKYSLDLNKVYEDSRFIVNPKSENRVIFILKENISAKKIANLFSDFPEEVNIEIYNQKKHDEDLKVVQTKYADFLSKNSMGMGCSTGPSYVDTIIATLDWFGIYVLFPWMIKNILDDINDKAWSKVKNSFKNVLSVFHEKKDKNIGFTFWIDSWHIIFVFNLKLDKNIIINGLENIPLVVKDIKDGKYTFLSLVFELDKNTGEWVQTNNKHTR